MQSTAACSAAGQGEPLTDSYQAQNGEDRWLEKYFKGKRDGIFVEVGAYDGVHLSNTFHFEQIGWSGILIEPDPDKAVQCRRARPGATTFQCAVVGPEHDGEIVFHQVAGGEVYSTTTPTTGHRRRLDGLGLGWREVRVAARTLDSILVEVMPARIDFVSIDVEGGEMAVLRGFDIRRWQPAVVIVETNTRMRDPAVRDYFVKNGYAYFVSIDVNDFYVPVAAGAGAARAIDGTRYLLHRAQRRLKRTGQLLHRAWRKHVIGGDDR